MTVQTYITDLVRSQLSSLVAIITHGSERSYAAMMRKTGFTEPELKVYLNLIPHLPYAKGIVRRDNVPVKFDVNLYAKRVLAITETSLIIDGVVLVNEEGGLSAETMRHAARMASNAHADGTHIVLKTGYTLNDTIAEHIMSLHEKGIILSTDEKLPH